MSPRQRNRRRERRRLKHAREKRARVIGKLVGALTLISPSMADLVLTLKHAAGA